MDSLVAVAWKVSNEGIGTEDRIMEWDEILE